MINYYFVKCAKFSRDKKAQVVNLHLRIFYKNIQNSIIHILFDTIFIPQQKVFIKYHETVDYLI